MSETLVEHNVDPSALTEGNEAIEARIQELRAELAQLESEAFRRDAWGMHDADESTQADLEAYFASRDYKDDNGRLHDATNGNFKSEHTDTEEIIAERNDSLVRMSLKELIAAGAEAHAVDNMQLQAVIEDALVEKLATYAEKYHWSAEAQSQHLEHAIDQIHGNTAAQASADLEAFDDDYEAENGKSKYQEAMGILFNEELFYVRSVGKKNDDGTRLIVLHNTTDDKDVITSEQALEEGDAKILSDAEFTSRIHPVHTIDISTLERFNNRERSETNNDQNYDGLLTSTSELLDEIATAEAAEREGNPDSVYHRLRDWWANKRAQVYAEGTLAALDTAERFQSTNDEGNEKKRAWVKPVVAIGIAAVGFAAWKYGIQPRINGEHAQAAGDVAGSAATTVSKHANKLTHVQEQLIHAPGKYPYGHYEHIYGDQAAAEISKAVKRLHAAGVKVIEHGSGRDYWIEVPAKNGSMTSNTQRVVEVLATGRV